MNEEDRLQLIDDYLSRRLTLEESLAFEKDVSNDPDLAKELASYRDIVEGIKLDGKLKEWRRHMTSLNGGQPKMESANDVPAPVLNLKPQKGKPQLTLWRWAAGVAAIFLISIGSYLYMDSGSNRALYSKYYQPYSGSVQLSVLRGDTSTNPEEQAIQAYDTRNYTEAEHLLRTVISKHPEDPDWHFYLGITYMELNNYKDAEANLSRVAQNSESLLYKQARWYLALLFLKKDQRDEAKKILNNLKNEKGVYAEKARDLYERL